MNQFGHTQPIHLAHHCSVSATTKNVTATSLCLTTRAETGSREATGGTHGARNQMHGGRRRWSHTIMCGSRGVQGSPSRRTRLRIGQESHKRGRQELRKKEERQPDSLGPQGHPEGPGFLGREVFLWQDSCFKTERCTVRITYVPRSWPEHFDSQLGVLWFECGNQLGCVTRGKFYPWLKVAVPTPPSCVRT